ncbi:MAG TPA: hypothetical protein VGC85_04405 [Chthoniobacterales bacterium]
MHPTANESQHTHADNFTYRLAQILGVFSLVLGVSEMIWADWIAQHIGLGGYEWLIRVYGAREFTNGVLILIAKDPTPWIWLRVIGDLLDSATLAWGYLRDPSHMMGVMNAFTAVTPVVIADFYAAFKLSSEASRAYYAARKPVRQT